MSLLLRLNRTRQLLQFRPILLRTSRPELSPSTNLITPCIQTRWSQTAPKGSDKDKDDDGFKYKISFKQEKSIKELFKDFYSLYGPLFLCCHIGIGLSTLGFFYGAVWLVVDPILYIPTSLLTILGSQAMTLTSGGGKFVIAYALHKLTLPVRFGASIFLTRFLAKKLKIKRKKTT